MYILNLVLQYLPIYKLREILFLSKHIHNVILELFNRKQYLIHDLNSTEKYNESIPKIFPLTEMKRQIIRFVVKSIDEYHFFRQDCYNDNILYLFWFKFNFNLDEKINNFSIGYYDKDLNKKLFKSFGSIFYYSPEITPTKYYSDVMNDSYLSLYKDHRNIDLEFDKNVKIDEEEYIFVEKQIMELKKKIINLSQYTGFIHSSNDTEIIQNFIKHIRNNSDVLCLDINQNHITEFKDLYVKFDEDEYESDLNLHFFPKNELQKNIFEDVYENL